MNRKRKAKSNSFANNMNPATHEQPSKKIKISPSNVDEYERVFMLEHDVAMGYKTPNVLRAPKVKSTMEQFMEQHPVLSPLHVSFRTWIARTVLAKFDCFQLRNWMCECYKCAAWQKKEDHEWSVMEAIKSDHERSQTTSNVSGVTASDRILGSRHGNVREDDVKSGNPLQPSISENQENNAINSSNICHF